MSSITTARENVKQSTNGHASRLDESLRRVLVPDNINIGSVDYTQGEQDETGSWAELKKDNAKVRYLVPGWVPYAMLTGVIGEPKAGKSNFVLWAVVRPIITGKPWFTGARGSES